MCSTPNTSTTITTEMCLCNKLGSVDHQCDPVTGQCQCQKNVDGLKCNRCRNGYYGFSLIAVGRDGCTG